tara:strand:+ start:352 stop:561 length:210 start_codon:yes stop_codon:yes gene_type:complete
MKNFVLNYRLITNAAYGQIDSVEGQASDLPGVDQDISNFEDVWKPGESWVLQIMGMYGDWHTVDKSINQ